MWKDVGGFLITTGGGYVVKYDSSHKVQWRVYPTADFSYNSGYKPTSVSATADGGFIITTDGGYVVKYDSSHKVQWRVYPTADFSYNSGYKPTSVSATADGGFIITTASSAGYAGFVIKYDSNHNVQWRVYPTSDFSYDSGYEPTAVSATADGGFIITTASSAGYAGFVVKYDSNHNVQWRVYPTADFSYDSGYEPTSVSAMH